MTDNTNSETEEITEEQKLYKSPISKEWNEKDKEEDDMTFCEKTKYFFKLLFYCCGRI